MNLKLYSYKNCGTCQKAIQFLKANKIEFIELPIREQIPSLVEIKKMLKYYNGDSRKLFNTSGKDYKDLNLKDKLGSMSLEDQLILLSKNGNLIKRPFVLGSNWGLVGFKEDEWKEKIK
jgi:arsenate reductase